MTTGRTKDRIYYLDYLRGFLVLLVVLDHSMHAYSQRYSRFWFFPDIERSTFIDILHLHNDAIMMPFLFFLAGMFVLPSLKRRGYFSFMKERFIRIVLPFIFGIFLITPFMVYHKMVIRDNLNQSFIRFWWDSYIRWQNTPFENISQGGFWFLYMLFMLTLALLIVHAFFPRIMDFIAAFVKWCIAKPFAGFVTVALILAFILGASDLKWGAPWWIGFKPVFHVRGSRFIAKILFFFLGAGCSHAGLNHNKIFQEELAQNWKMWVGIAIIFFAIYVSYTLAFFDSGAYSDAVRYHFYHGGNWEEAIEVFCSNAPLILIRTTLLGLVMISLIIMYISVFKHFLDKPHKGWMSLAACSYGIYIFHEPFTTGTHMLLYGNGIDPIIKFIITSVVSLGISWFLVAQVFLRLPGFKRVL